MKKRVIALGLVFTLLLALLAGCGNGSQSAAVESAKTSDIGSASEKAETAEEEPETVSDETAGSEGEAEPADDTADTAEETDLTASNAAMDFGPWQEMLKSLTTELPVVEEPETLSYFFGFESSSLNYIPGGELKNHQIWSALEDITGVHLDLTVVEATSAEPVAEEEDLPTMVEPTAAEPMANEEDLPTMVDPQAAMLGEEDLPTMVEGDES